MKLCPDCSPNSPSPSRDQRDATQDGRCIVHHDSARLRPDASARKQRQHSEQPVLAEAYV